jgi:glycosyltransferase involved in cell wall biosynthesis
VVLDAFAMSRPVVTSERSTLRGYVDDGRNGLIVPAEDPAALLEAVERVLGDATLAEELGRRGRADVEERFTTRGFAASIADQLAAIVR